MWWRPDKFEDRKPFLMQRMAVMNAVRWFFDDQGFWAVETPALQISPGMDTHIHGFKTTLKDQNLNVLGDMYLHTSPEFAMKKLLVAGAQNIYQICPVYRNGENTVLHSPEFTMLEWYRAGAHYTDIMRDCEELLRDVVDMLEIDTYQYDNKRCDPYLDFERLSVLDAFKTYAGIDLERVLDDTSGFFRFVQDQNIRTAPDDRWDDLFHRVMAEKIEPNLGAERPCFLYDYPASMAMLARRKPEDERFAERFELYVCGVELANAYGELTDPAEQRARFEADMIEKQALYNEAYPVEEDFLAALDYGLPDSSGIALGLDRLVMLVTGAKTIEQVLWAGKH